MPPFEPALEEDLSDANLARLLAADARSASHKYSTQGLSALLGGRPSATPKAKPNTRFLKNLVKNADTHNDRLKRKEDADRKEKLRVLDEHDEERKREERAKRREKRVGEDDRERKRRRLDNGDEDEERQHSSRHRHRGRDKEKRHRRHQRRNTSSESSKSRSMDRQRSRDRRKDENHKSHRKHRSRREANGSGSDKAYANHRPHHKHRRRHSGSLSPLAKGGEVEDQDQTTKVPQAQNNGITSGDPEVTPRRPRSSSPRKPSKMDVHFSTDYNPATDVHVNSEEDSDWDRALNAMRDRANFQRTQAARLLAAGFSEEQVKQWETRPSRSDPEHDGDARDLKWKAKGEEREWDRGKPMLGEDVTFSDDEDVIENDKDPSQMKPERKIGAQEGWKKSGGLLMGFKNALGS